MLNGSKQTYSYFSKDLPISLVIEAKLYQKKKENQTPTFAVFTYLWLLFF
jgi:hypothetical protein